MKRSKPFVPSINNKLEQVHLFIEQNKIFRISSNEAEKQRKKMIENKWKFPDKSKFTTEKWEYLSNAWYLTQNITEYYMLIEMDYLELIKLVALKMVHEFQGISPKS